MSCARTQAAPSQTSDGCTASFPPSSPALSSPPACLSSGTGNLAPTSAHGTRNVSEQPGPCPCTEQVPATWPPASFAAAAAPNTTPSILAPPCNRPAAGERGGQDPFTEGETGAHEGYPSSLSFSKKSDSEVLGQGWGTPWNLPRARREQGTSHLPGPRLDTLDDMNLLPCPNNPAK